MEQGMNGNCDNGFNTFLTLFNTILGLTNMDKNTASQEHSKIIENKLDMVLERLDRLEGMFQDKEGGMSEDA